MNRLIKYSLIAALLLSGCAKDKLVTVAKPVYVAGEVVEVERVKTVPVDKKLLVKCPWSRDVRLSQAPGALAERAKCLIQYEAQLDSVGKIEGRAK